MEEVKFRTIKKEIRVLGIDDAPFVKGSKGKVLLIGVIARGGQSIDGVISTTIDIDGNDVTERLAELIKRTRHEDIRVLMLNGITFGGFNTVNISDLHKRTGLPVVVVIRKNPDIAGIKRTIDGLPYRDERLAAMQAAGTVKKFRKVYYQSVGLEEEKVKELLTVTTTRSYIPEPIRVAHLMAAGIVLGESKGRA